MGGSVAPGPGRGNDFDVQQRMGGARDPSGSWGGVMPYGGGRGRVVPSGRPPGFAGDDPSAPGTGNSGGGGQTHDIDWLKALAEKYGIAWPGTGGTGGTGGTAPQTLAWAFPQYSQTWAFTPPAPVYPSLPPPFDANKDKKKSKTPTSWGGSNG